MDATFLEKLRTDYPQFVFSYGKRFSFVPPKHIYIGPDESGDRLLLLHELGHALSGHRDFTTEAERLRMEREAWEKARELAEKYRVEFDENQAESELDSYRDWLHKKSSCPICGLTMYQSTDGVFHCPRCENLT